MYWKVRDAKGVIEAPKLLIDIHRQLSDPAHHGYPRDSNSTVDLLAEITEALCEIIHFDG